MEGALVLFGVDAVGKAVAHYHICLAREDGSAEGARRFRGVGIVAVDHEIAVGVDVAEHLPADVALAWRGSCLTIAPRVRAISAVPSVELLS